MVDERSGGGEDVGRSGEGADEEDRGEGDDEASGTRKGEGGEGGADEADTDTATRASCGRGRRRGGRDVTAVSRDQLTRDMQPFARQLIDDIGIMHAEADWPINADDLLFYLSNASMPMAAFMHEHSLFIDGDSLHFDLAQFGAIKELAEKIIAAHDAGDFDGVWKELDLSGDEDVDYNGGYILTALAALELIYASPK